MPCKDRKKQGEAHREAQKRYRQRVSRKNSDTQSDTRDTRDTQSDTVVTPNADVSDTIVTPISDTVNLLVSDTLSDTKSDTVNPVYFKYGNRDLGEIYDTCKEKFHRDIEEQVKLMEVLANGRVQTV